MSPLNKIDLTLFIKITLQDYHMCYTNLSNHRSLNLVSEARVSIVVGLLTFLNCEELQLANISEGKSSTASMCI